MAFLRAHRRIRLWQSLSLYFFISGVACEASGWREWATGVALLCVAERQVALFAAAQRKQVTKLFTAFASISKESVREPPLFFLWPLRAESELNHQIYPGHQNFFTRTKKHPSARTGSGKKFTLMARGKNANFTRENSRSRFLCFYSWKFCYQIP